MISIKKVSELEKMLCSYNFLAQNLLIMMTFCCVWCLKTGGLVSMISVLWTTAALMGAAEPSHHSPLLGKDCPLFLAQGSGLLFLKPTWSVDGIRALPYPLSPRILLEQKAGA